MWGDSLSDVAYPQKKGGVVTRFVFDRRRSWELALVMRDRLLIRGGKCPTGM